MFTKSKISLLMSAGIIAFLLMGCSGYRSAAGDPAHREIEQKQVDLALAEFKHADPSLQTFFDSAYAYAIFPNVGKGGIGVGGAYGRGLVYEQGRVIGYASLTQGTLGVQLGGQTYSELIFFQTQENLEHFKQNRMEFSAQASAVAATAGKAASADYHEGVAVFTKPKGGLMFEASIGGQKFSFVADERASMASGSHAK